MKFADDPSAHFAIALLYVVAVIVIALTL